MQCFTSEISQLKLLRYGSVASFVLVITCLVSPIYGQPGGEHWIAPVCDDHSIVVARVSPGKADVKRLGVRLRSLFPSVRTAITDLLIRSDRLKADLEKQGIAEFSILISTHAGPGLPPMLCLPSDSVAGSDQTAIVKELVSKYYDAAYEVKRVGPTLIAGPEPAIARLLKNLERQRPQDRIAAEQIQRALELDGQHALRVVARISDDHRRAIEQRQLELPGWLGGGSPQALLDSVGLLHLRLSAADDIALTLQAEPLSGVEADQKQMAELGLLLKERLELILGEMGVPDAVSDELISESLVVDDSTASVALSSGMGAFRVFTQSVVPKLDNLFAEKAKARASLQMRQIVLQIHNHESAYKFLPGGIDRGESYNGQLSWRVHILPFLGDAEAELFRKFNLTEDWDSENNKALIPLMPAVFIMPNSALVPSQGLSNFCVPTGPKTMWPLDKVLKFEDVTDGPANTISVVEVQDKFAQVWTKPDTFEVDPAELSSKLGGHFEGVFLMATLDGAFAFRPLDFDPDLFARMLTRAAGD